MVKELATIEEFDECVSSGKYVIVDFTAAWCGPCQAIKPVFAELAESAKKVVLVKVDVDANEEAAAKGNVTAMPTFQVWKDGKMIEEFKGAQQEKLKALVEKYEAM